MKKTLLLFLFLSFLTNGYLFSQNNALHYDGVNDYVSIPELGTNITSFTFEAWIKPESGNPDMGLLMTNIWSDKSLHLQFSNGVLFLAVNGLNISESGNFWPKLTRAPEYDTWQHIAVSYDGSTKKIIFYYNGIESGSYTYSALPVVHLTAASIGCWDGGSRFYKGAIDDVRIWNVARTAEQINTEIDGSESGLFAYYDFNQGVAYGENSTVTTLTDNVPTNPKNGTLYNFSLQDSTSNWVKSRNNALYFDGSNDYVYAPINASNLGQYTIETWVNTNSGIGGIFTSDYASLCIWNKWLGISINRHSIECEGNIIPGKWYHLAVTYDINTALTYIYVNGQLIFYTYITPHYANMSFISIGTHDIFNNFNGKIDEFCVWGTVRSNAEIVSDMRNGLTGNESGLLAYYTFDQGIADGINTNVNKLFNSLPDGMDGTLNNFELTGTSSNWTEGYNMNSVAHYLSASVSEIKIERQSGSQASFEVKCVGDWTASENASWFTINKTSGRDFDNIVITADENINITERSDTVKLTLKDGSSPVNVIVTQKRGTVSFAEADVNLTAASGNTNSLNINSNTNWTLSAPASWYSLSELSGTNNAVITVTSTSENQNQSDRIDTLIISGTYAINDTVIIRQKKAAMFVSQKEIAIDTAANSNAYLNIVTSVNWTASCTASWLTVSSLTGTGPDTLTLIAEALPIGVTHRAARIEFTGLFTPVSVIVIQSVQPDNALAFDGINDYVNIDTLSSAIDFSNGFSFAGWVKWNAFNPYSRVFDFGNGAASDNILLYNNTSGFLALASFNGATESTLTSPIALPKDKWVYIATTISNTGNAKIYVNGAVVASGTINLPNSITRNLNFLGKSNWSADGYFNGSIDEVSIWNKELNQSEITTGMNSGFAIGISNILAYYKFNQGIAGAANNGKDILNDFSDKAQQGTLMNFTLDGTSSNWVDSSPKKSMLASATTSLDSTAGTSEIAVFSNINWTANSSASWLVLNTNVGYGNDTLTVTYTANRNNYEQRTATISLAGVGADTVVLTFTQEAGNLLTPEFSANTTLSFINDTIKFNNLSTISNPSITSWHWDFGDGNTSTEQNPSHVYTNTGKFTITLIASDGIFSDTLVKENYIEINNSINMHTGSVIVTDTINFYDSGGKSNCYKDEEDYTFVFYPGTAGNYIQIDFSVLEGDYASNMYDFISIYDGTTTLAPLIGSYAHLPATPPLKVKATNPDGALCVRWVSDGSWKFDGWEAKVYQVLPVDFTAGQTIGMYPFSVSFTDKSAMPNLTSWSWDFGDGSTSNEQSPAHTYNSKGNYNVKLVVSDGTLTDSISKENYIQVSDFTTRFSADITSGYLPTVQFSDKTIGNATSWLWDFGDGTTSDIQNPSHSYSTGGIYTVSLISSNGVNTDTLVQEDYISARPFDAAFSADITSGFIQNINFTDNSAGSGITSWHWDFGDGTTSDEQNPVHKYNTAGTYTVSLIISNSIFSDTVIMENYITVKSKNDMVISWPGQVPITYGNPAGNGIMNASANIDGVFTYSFSPDSIFKAGSHLITATLTPTESYYPAVTKTISFVVNKADLLITADNQVIEEGSEIPELSYSYSGFANGEGLSDISVLPTTFTRATSSSPVGDYEILVYGAYADNYNFIYTNGTLSISNLKVPAITWDSPAPISYSTALSETQLNAVVSYSGNTVAGTYTYNPVLGTLLQAGNVQALNLIFTPDNPTEYATVSKTVSIDVNRAVLTVTADNKTKVYGEDNPDFTFSYSGFVNGEDESVLSTAPLVITTADNDCDAGNYTITFIKGNDINYEFVYNTAIFSVTPRPLTLSNFTANSKEYDGTTAVPDAGFSDDRLTSDELTFAYHVDFEDKNIGYDKNVNYSNIVISGGSDIGNYSLLITTGSAIANITAKELTIGGSFTVGNHTYDGTTEAVISENNLTLNGVITGDDVSLNPVAEFASANIGTNIDVYLTNATSITGNDAGNYLLSFAGAPSTIANIEADTEKPVISDMPENITVNTDEGMDYATVLWTEPTAIDNVGVVSFTSNYSSGSQFNVGETIVTYTAADAVQNSYSESFSIFVRDIEKPVITGIPSDITLSTDEGKNYATVTWTEPTATDNVGIDVFSSNLANGTRFNLGTTLVTYIAVDESNNEATATFNVTVIDTEAPVFIGIPQNLTAYVKGDVTSVSVDWGTLWATDNVGVISLSSSHLPGDVFPLGITTVTYTALDAAGNTTNISFTVEVISDGVKPVITNMPQNMEVSTDVGKNYATVTWTEPTATDNLLLYSFESDYSSGSQFPLGTTTVTYTAVDFVGNTETANFTIIVNDSEKPVISGMPENITVNTDEGMTYATVTWIEPSATDNVGVANFAADYTNGSQFSVGTTTVTYTATDAANNVQTASFAITVNNSTGIPDSNKNNLSVYPNPVKDILKISTGNINDNGTYTIFSTLGIPVNQGDINNGSTNVNMEKLNSGLYILQLQINNLYTTFNIVKE